MKLSGIFFFALFLASTSFKAQTKFRGDKIDIESRGKYFIQSKIDKIVFCKTKGGVLNDTLNRAVFNELLSDWRPSTMDLSVAQKYYEEIRVVTDSAMISEFVKSLPLDSCQSYSVSRCPPVYRDIILFYNGAELVTSLKVCLECGSTVSVPYKYESRCIRDKMGDDILWYLAGDDMYLMHKESSAK